MTPDRVCDECGGQWRAVSQQQWVWNGVHSALVRINEELLERKVAAPV
jgi:hypothetical protein